MSLGNSVVWQGTTYTKNPDTGFYVSDEDDGGIIDSHGNYYDTASGEYVGNVSSASATPTTGSFFGDLWNNISAQLTSPDNIKAAVQTLIGKGALPASAATNIPNPNYAPPKSSSNTMLYAVVGVLVVGASIGIFMYMKKHKK